MVSKKKKYMNWKAAALIGKTSLPLNSLFL